jgi:C1A family cysteine protease
LQASATSLIGRRLGKQTKEICMSNFDDRVSLGWLPDLPSIKDYDPSTATIKPLLAKLRRAGAKTAAPKLATSIDLRPWCSPIENQLNLGSCTANAGVGLLEFYERRAYGKHIDGSRLFLYKTTRNLLKWTGDTGAYLRSTLQSLVMFGVPPEDYWPYVAADFDKEPSAFLYSLASNYQALNYYRLDPAGTSKTTLLGAIKTNLAGHLPSIFGFTVYSSYTQANAANKGAMPYPVPTDKVVGGHAVMAVGFNDTLQLKNAGAGGVATTGALLIRNSWGTGWGDGGYGWLPYEYVLKGQAVDWWTLISAEYVDTGKFG